MASSSLSPGYPPSPLTPLDNLVFGIYDHKVLFFPASGSDVSSIAQNLTSALAQTFKAIPLLSGTITPLPDARQKGRWAVTAPWRTSEDVITVKDLRETDYPSYESLRSKHFPMSDINYPVMMPTQFSMLFQKVKSPVVENPVLLAQINYFKGGISLGMMISHAFTDGSGSVTVGRVWAAYCRGEDGSQLVSPDLVDRSRLMEGENSARIEDLGDHLYYAESAQPPSKPKSEPFAGELFFFTKAKLKELKEMVSKLESDETSWISTNDALASLIWCCVIAAKKACILDNLVVHSINDDTSSLKDFLDDQPSRLGFLMDARQMAKPPLPAGFIGNVFTWGSIVKPLSTVTSTPEGVTECAHSLRRKVKQYGDNYLPRLIGAVNSVPDISRVRLGRTDLDEWSFGVNSWAAMDWYDLDWGQLVGGRVERIRIQESKAMKFCRVLPEIKYYEGRNEAAGLEVIISMETYEMKILRENELFNRFAEWRCC
ncbi:hypothetical protein JMJ35_007116 [Cladonia borealis]|uniref:Uncharacterized protein n=1 Tax=Cladonia borealis TaxID=184061 RepID=A0AA39QYK0_9LECA|nr:hypothetical protein JMJ35_007116 [Cladonia borealis]